MSLKPPLYELPMNQDEVRLKPLIEEFLLYEQSVACLAENSVAAYRRDLQKLCAFFGGEKEITLITAAELRSCIASLSTEKMSQATINRFIAAVRSLFAYCKKFEYIHKDTAAELKTVKVPQKLPSFMTQDEIDVMCALPLKMQSEEKPILWPSRDKAIFEMFYSSGCRVSELQALTLQNFPLAFSHDFSRALVTGKGSKEREVFFSDEAVAAFKAYLAERDNVCKIAGGKANEKIFVNQKGNAISVRGIRYIVERYSGVEGTNRHISPHAFRHTFASVMLTNGADIRLVQEMLGHENISTTQRYTHISKMNLVKTYTNAHPHGKMKG